MASSPSDTTRVFATRQRVGLQAAAHIAGGLAVLGAILCWFLRLIASPARPGDNVIPGILGGISVIWVGLLARGALLLRLTVRVVLDPTAIHIQATAGSRSVAWRDIDHVERDKRSAFMSDKTYQVIHLVGRNGRRLATLADTVVDFDAMAAEITARSAATGLPTVDAAQDEERQLARESRRRRWTTVGAALLTILMIGGLCAGIYEELHVRRYASEGVRTDAAILRRWMVRVTPRVEYSFKDGQGRTWTREAMMFQGPRWDELQSQTTVPVEYLPSDPAWNRLVAGEDAGPQFGGIFIYVCLAGSLLCGTLFVTTLLGFDLKLENGVSTLTRHGRVLKTWGTPRA